MPLPIHLFLETFSESQHYHPIVYELLVFYLF